MSTLEASPETVFNPAYWENEARGFPARKLDILPRGTNQLVDALCAQTATEIYHDNDSTLELLPDCTRVGGYSRECIGQHGDVILADIEIVSSSSKHPKDEKSSVPPWQSRHMENPADIGLQAVDLFKKNAYDQILPSDRREVRVYPYDKSLLSDDERLSYRRYVGLIVFARAVHGDPVGFQQRQWSTTEVNQVQGFKQKSEPVRAAIQPMVIGQTYEFERAGKLVKLRAGYLSQPAEIDTPPPRRVKRRLPSLALPSAGRLAIGFKSAGNTSKPALGF